MLLIGIGSGVPALGQAAEVGRNAGGSGRILLVLPFDNRTGQPSLEWIREAAPEILGSRFASAGFAPMSRADRLYALDHLGLAAGVSALAGQFAEAGADAGRRLDRRGQLCHRWDGPGGRGPSGGRAAPAHERGGDRRAVRCAT